MTTITLNLSDELLAKLQAQATQHDMALEAYITSALSDMTDDDELTDEEILANLKISFKQALSGQTMAWEDTMALLRQEFIADVHED
mgnify:CR=1 FL=1